MSLIVPPSSIFAGQSNRWWRRSAALKMTCGAFVAGAVFAGLALKVPASLSSGAATTAEKPAAAEKRGVATTSAAPCEQQTWPYTSDGCRSVKPAAKVQVAPSPIAEPVRVIAPAKEPVVTATAAIPPETPRSQTSRPEADVNVGSAPRSPAQAELGAGNPILVQKTPLPKPRPGQMAAQQALDSERAAQAVADRENALAASESPAPPSRTITPVKETIVAPKGNDPQESSRKAPPREIKAAAAPTRDEKRVQQAERPSPTLRSQVRQARSDEGATQRADRADRSVSRARSQSLQAQNEAEGFSLVRSHRLPDGRRVTVYRRVLDEGSSRAMAYGDPYRSRRMSLSPFPFSFW